MAPVLFPRVDAATPSPTPGLSSNIIIGIAVVCGAGIGLVMILVFVSIRRRTQTISDSKTPQMVMVQPYIKKEPLPADIQAIRGPGLGRSVSRRNLTPSVILPTPVPPVPAARPRPPKFSPIPNVDPAGRPLSSAEVVAHHQAAGNTPRPFAPFSFALNSSTLDIPNKRISTASASVSRASILSASLRNSSLRNSLSSSLRSSFSNSGPGGPELHKVRQVFTPLLPDELVLRPNEKVSLIQSFDDGWCVVGRKSAFHAPSSTRHGAYAFGQGQTADEIEIGAVPLWVFEKRTNGNSKLERPMRSSSLGITLLVDASDSPREDVISWSNF